MVPERRVFTSLDGLRGIAAIAVLVRHVPDKTMATWLPGGYLAVDLFFVLSGFVLAHSYLSRLRTGMSTREFMRVRLIRLYPLYILGTLIAVPFIYRTLQHADTSSALTTTTEWLAFAVLFVPALGLNPPYNLPYPLNHPAWSLFFELLANLLLALVAPRLTSRMLIAMLGVGLVALAVTSVRFHGLDVGWELANFGGGLGRVFYSFFAGVGVYHFWQAGAFSRIKLPMPAAALLMLAVFALEPAHGQELYDFAIATVGFPVLVLGAARLTPGPVLAPICAALGRASYGIYVLQVAALYVGMSVVKHLPGEQLVNHGLMTSACLIVFTIAVALAADRYFDRPVRTALARTFAAPLRNAVQIQTP